MPEIASRCFPGICGRSGRVGEPTTTSHALSQLFVSLRLLLIIIGAGCRGTVLQLNQPWDEVLEFIFDIFAFLGRNVNWVLQHRIETHVIVLDERVDASQA